MWKNEAKSSYKRISYRYLVSIKNVISILILIFANYTFPNSTDSLNKPISKVSLGLSLQPFKYKIAIDGKIPYAQADFIIRKDGKWYFAKLSWLELFHKSSCYGCNRSEPSAQSPNIDEIKLFRMGISRRYLVNEKGFSFFHEPGINIIRWYWRNSEFLRLGTNSIYEEDREEYEFLGFQPIEYCGMQWYYGYFIASLSVGLGINLGLNNYEMKGVARKPSVITVPISFPDLRFISGDFNFGIGFSF